MKGLHRSIDPYSPRVRTRAGVMHQQIEVPNAKMPYKLHTSNTPPVVLAYWRPKAEGVAKDLAGCMVGCDKYYHV